LGLVWMTVFGPATENPTYTLLAPVAAGAVASTRGLLRGLSILAAVLLLMPILRGMFATSEFWPLRTAQPLAGFLLVPVILAATRHRLRQLEPAQVVSGVALAHRLFRAVR
ncbi:MAG: hypothetical protein ACRCZF_14115, partial [Gemmataceae bacterium]